MVLWDVLLQFKVVRIVLWRQDENVEAMWDWTDSALAAFFPSWVIRNIDGFV